MSHARAYWAPADPYAPRIRDPCPARTDRRPVTDRSGHRPVKVSDRLTSLRNEGCISVAVAASARATATTGGRRGLGRGRHGFARWRQGRPGPAEGLDPLDGDVTWRTVLDECVERPARGGHHRGTTGRLGDLQRRSDALDRGGSRSGHGSPVLQAR